MRSGTATGLRSVAIRRRWLLVRQLGFPIRYGSHSEVVDEGAEFAVSHSAEHLVAAEEHLDLNTAQIKVFSGLGMLVIVHWASRDERRIAG